MSTAPTSASVHYTTPTARTTAEASRDLRVHAGALRDRVELLSEDVNTHHQVTQHYDLAERASAKVRRGASHLLEELATERGMSWRDIARAAGVSTSAVRKWRAGETPSPEKRSDLAMVSALLDLLEEFPIDDPAGWLEVPILHGYSVRALDLLTAGRFDLILEYAGGRLSATQTLGAFSPGWREKFATTFEIFTASDGVRSMRPSA